MPLALKASVRFLMVSSSGRSWLVDGVGSRFFEKNDLFDRKMFLAEVEARFFGGLGAHFCWGKPMET